MRKWGEILGRTYNPKKTGLPREGERERNLTPLSEEGIKVDFCLRKKVGWKRRGEERKIAKLCKKEKCEK